MATSVREHLASISKKGQPKMKIVLVNTVCHNCDAPVLPPGGVAARHGIAWQKLNGAGMLPSGADRICVQSNPPVIAVDESLCLGGCGEKRESKESADVPGLTFCDFYLLRSTASNMLLNFGRVVGEMFLFKCS